MSVLMCPCPALAQFVDGSAWTTPSTRRPLPAARAPQRKVCLIHLPGPGNRARGRHMDAGEDTVPQISCHLMHCCSAFFWAGLSWIRGGGRSGGVTHRNQSLRTPCAHPSHPSLRRVIQYGAADSPVDVTGSTETWSCDGPKRSPGLA